MMCVELEDMELCILLDSHVHLQVVAHNDVVQGCASKQCESACENAGFFFGTIFFEKEDLFLLGLHIRNELRFAGGRPFISVLHKG
jgi:hypothetical protein